MKKTHHLTVQGPELDHPFTVLIGFVVICTATNESLLVPAGGCWPGLANISATLSNYLKPVGTTQTPDTRVSFHVSAAAIEGGVACLLVQALTRIGLLGERIRFAENYVQFEEMNQATAAGVVGTSRETLSQALKRRPR
jgi:hypothetical protein